MNSNSTPNYKALCAELLAAMQTDNWEECEEVWARAEAALAQPEPVAPTDEDVTELFYRHMGEGSEVGFENAIAEALARWGTPANAINQEYYDHG